MLPAFVQQAHLFPEVFETNFLIGYCEVGQTHTNEFMKELLPSS